MWLSGEAIALGTVMTATVGWFVSNRTSHFIDRRAHTHRMHREFTRTQQFIDCLKTTRNVAREARKKNKDPDVDFSKSGVRADNIGFVLDHFEFVAVGIFGGDLDEETVRECDYGLITSAFDIYIKPINAYRGAKDQDDIYVNLSDLVARWKDRNNRPFFKRWRANIYEGYFKRPLARDRVSEVAKRKKIRDARKAAQAKQTSRAPYTYIQAIKNKSTK